MKKFAIISPLVLIFGLLFITSMPVAAETPVSGYTAGFQGLLLLGLFFSIIVASVVIGLLVYVIIKYRSSSNTERKRIRNELRLEIAIIVFATVIVSILFVASIPATQNFITEPEYDETVTVIGYLYNWTFIKEDGTRTTGYVHLEAGTSYLFNMTSLDVIHSFYANDLAIKVDILPGRYNKMWLQIFEPGTYEVHCAEYCGTGHYFMIAYLIVE